MDRTELLRALEKRELELHLFILNALLVAQPLLDLIRRQFEFVVAHGLTTLEARGLAVALVVVPPAFLILLRLLLMPRRPEAFTPVAVGLFGVLLVLQLLKRVEVHHLGGGLPVVVLSLAAGGGFGWLYLKAKLLRSFITLLAPALIIVPVVFILDEQASKLNSTNEEPPFASREVEMPHPVVFVIFDELGSAPLLDDQGGINARRYPHLAELAERAYWFENASTISCRTERAVPAILTGRLPREDKLPVLEDHGTNLFTLLGGQYEIVADEEVTQLCPESFHSTGRQAMARGGGLSLVADLGVVYAHLVVPDPYVGRLPPIDEGWRDFGHRTVSDRQGSRLASFRDFLDTIGRGSDPTLYYHHSLLPHLPYRYLPSGKVLGPSSGVSERPPADGHARTRLYKRYLFQVALVDRLVGDLVFRLEERDLFDRAIVVITGDHGYRGLATGRPELRRAAEAECLSVPLLVKLPGQKQGLVVSEPVSSIDILPTLAEVLGIYPPPELEGRSLFADGPRPLQVFSNQELTALDPEVHDRTRELSRWIDEYFGDGAERLDLFRAGSRLPELLGASRKGLRVVDDFSVSLTMDDGELDYDPSATEVPALVRGSVGFESPPKEDWEAVVLINGRVEATAPLYDWRGSAKRFVVTISEERLEAGRNRLEVLLALPEDPRLLRRPRG